MNEINKKPEGYWENYGCGTCGHSRLVEASNSYETIRVLYCDYFRYGTPPFMKCARWQPDDDGESAGGKQWRH